jgi:Uma2 family endonuclease
MAKMRWTVDQVADLPRSEMEDYEIINGELYVSTKPHWNHQQTCTNLVILLGSWNNQTNLGRINFEFGILFDPENGVGPDLGWISHARFATAIGDDGKLHEAPELIVEILSPGTANIARDRIDKLNLYSERGVSEYWIVDWRLRQIEIYRRANANSPLTLVDTLDQPDTLTSPILPGFSCQVNEAFRNIT